MKNYSIVEILGDGISAELSASVHATANALPFEVAFRQADLSLENRAKDAFESHRRYSPKQVVDALSAIKSNENNRGFG